MPNKIEVKIFLGEDGLPKEAIVKRISFDEGGHAQAIYALGGDGEWKRWIGLTPEPEGCRLPVMYHRHDEGLVVDMLLSEFESNGGGRESES